jgi:hypothetical protein
MSDITSQQSAVHDRDELRRRAMLDGDGEALSTLLHDGLIFIHAAGQWEDKPMHVAAVETGRIKYIKWNQTDIRSTPLGPEGWLKNGRLKLEVEFAGQGIELDLVFSSVWILDDEWKLISWQATPWPK